MKVLINRTIYFIIYLYGGIFYGISITEYQVVCDFVHRFNCVYNHVFRNCKEVRQEKLS